MFGFGEYNDDLRKLVREEDKQNCMGKTAQLNTTQTQNQNETKTKAMLDLPPHDVKASRSVLRKN